MSVEAMAVVLNHSKAKGTAKLVLVGIANHDGDGGAWCSVATLARYANVDERSVQRALVKLVGSGELRIDMNEGGTHRTPEHRRPNLYTIRLECPRWCDRSTYHRDTRKLAGPQQVFRGVTPVSPRRANGVTSVSPGGVTPVSPEPSLEPSAHQVVPQLQDTRPCSNCGQGQRKCERVQAAWPLEDRHTYAPRPTGATG